MRGIINMKTYKLYSPLKAEFIPKAAFEDPEAMFKNENQRDKLDGKELLQYEKSIREAVKLVNQFYDFDGEGNLMYMFKDEYGPQIKEKVISAVVSVEAHNGELCTSTTVIAREGLDQQEWMDFFAFLEDQFTCEWGENLLEVLTEDGSLYLEFSKENNFTFVIEEQNMSERTARYKSEQEQKER